MMRGKVGRRKGRRGNRNGDLRIQINLQASRESGVRGRSDTWQSASGVTRCAVQQSIRCSSTGRKGERERKKEKN